MDKSEAINKAKDYGILLSKHFTFEKMYMFGSYARDTYRADSDIDVAIVIGHTDEDYFSIHPLLWKLRRQIDDRIEPVLIERDKDRAGFLNEILKYGIDIICS